MKQEFLRLDWIAKSFDGIPILRYINLNLYQGEIHALMGANGVGKSTLLNIVSGQLAPDSGNFYVCDRLVSSFSLISAREHGIYTVENNPKIVPQFDLAGNVAIQLQSEQKKWIYNQAALRNHTRFLIQDLALEDILCDDLSGYKMSVLERQCLHILCAAANHARILVLDEPFSTLDVWEAIALKKLLLRLRERGISILLASHSFADVSELADRVSILRAGCCAATFENPHNASQLNTMVIQYMMNADERPDSPASASHVTEREIFRAERCMIPGLCVPLTFNVRAGEIFGIISFGAFCISVCEKIFGLEGHCTGSFLVEGRPAVLKTPTDALRAGIGFMSDDSHYQKPFPNLLIYQNITLPHLRRLFSLHIPVARVERYLAGLYQDFLLLNRHEISLSARHLSRGMQKRLSLARWFCVPHKLLMLNEPAMGLDAAGQAQLKEMVRKRSAEGAAFILESSSFDILTALCDRILLINNNQVMGVLNGPHITQQSILSAMLSDSTPGGDFLV